VTTGFFHPAVFYSVPDPAESGVGVSKVKFRVPGSEQGASEVLVEKDDALVANYTSFLWMQKLHNLILSVYREIVALACASIEPVINALMQPRRPQGPLQLGYQHAALSRPGGESDPKAQQEEAAGIRTFARSTRETLRGLGFMKTKPSYVLWIITLSHCLIKLTEHLGVRTQRGGACGARQRLRDRQVRARVQAHRRVAV
jgi:hypothetical protein